MPPDFDLAKFDAFDINGKSATLTVERVFFVYIAVVVVGKLIESVEHNLKRLLTQVCSWRAPNGNRI